MYRVDHVLMNPINNVADQNRVGWPCAKELRREVRDMKELVADLTSESPVLKKVIGDRGDEA